MVGAHILLSGDQAKILFIVRLKIRCPKGRAGSSPALGTIQDNLVICFAKNNSFVIVLSIEKNNLN